MASSRGRWSSPERTVVWTEPPPKTSNTTTRHYGTNIIGAAARHSRSGSCPFSSSPSAILPLLSRSPFRLPRRHVLDRLSVLRGAGMADAYSWSSKRSYRNGYVWHDLTADDPVHPANGNEYVLKGSELLVLPQLLARPRDASASSSSSSSTSSCQPNKNTSPVANGRAARRKNWSSFDLGEYRVAAVSRGAEMDAATHTHESRRGRRRNAAPEQVARTELGSDEISPPPLCSSPDTLETLIQHDARLAAVAAPQPTQAYTERREDVGLISGGRMRASAVLMQLISRGSISATAKQDRSRYTAERRLLSSSTAADGFSGSMSVGVSVGMEREYFSGSLVETKRTVAEDRAGVGGKLSALKRSSSYSGDR